jgi:hypothetical protein
VVGCPKLHSQQWQAITCRHKSAVLVGGAEGPTRLGGVTRLK